MSSGRPPQTRTLGGIPAETEPAGGAAELYRQHYGSLVRMAALMPGRYATQVSAIVAGLDLTQWAHHQGPQAAFSTSAAPTSAPTSVR